MEVRVLLDETHVFKDSVLTAPLDIVGCADGGKRIGLVADRHQPLRPQIRKRAHGHTINDAEYCGCRADSQRKGGDDSKGKTRTLPQDAKPIAYVLDRILD